MNEIFIKDGDKIISYLESHPEERDKHRENYFLAKGHEKYTPAAFIFAVLCVVIWVITGNFLALIASPSLLFLFKLISGLKYKRYWVRFGYLHRDLQPRRFKIGIIGIGVYLLCITILLITHVAQVV